MCLHSLVLCHISVLLFVTRLFQQFRWLPKHLNYALLDWRFVMLGRDVTEFEFDDVQRPTFSSDSKFYKCFERFVVECEFVEKYLFYD